MRVVGRGYVDAVRNLEVTFRSLGGGSKEKMQEDWESIDLGMKPWELRRVLGLQNRWRPAGLEWDSLLRAGVPRS